MHTHAQEHGIDYKIPTAVATSAVNVVAIALKDKAFARMMSKEPAAFPLASYGARSTQPIDQVMNREGHGLTSMRRHITCTLQASSRCATA